MSENFGVSKPRLCITRQMNWFCTLCALGIRMQTVGPAGRGNDLGGKVINQDDDSAMCECECVREFCGRRRLLC